jgi:hypothetical protein
MKCLLSVAPLVAAIAVASALSIDPRYQQQVALDSEQVIADDRCLIELSPGETRWVREEDKWELIRVWFRVGSRVESVR